MLIANSLAGWLTRSLCAKIDDPLNYYPGNNHPNYKPHKEGSNKLNLSPYEITSIAGGFTIIGALTGGFIGYRNALNIYKLSEFNKAAAQFRASFYPEILFLKHKIGSMDTPSGDQSVYRFMNAGFVNRHAKAFLVFIAAVPKKKTRSVENAWNEYQEKTKQYTSCPMKQDEADEALKQLEKFLNKYASTT